MKFYYFGGTVGGHHKEHMTKLEKNNFSGALFTYSPPQGDIFTFMARNIDLDQKIKYMIAIRPHALSAQYLCMVNQAMKSIAPGRLQINIIAGHIKPDEIDFGGIQGAVTDFSSVIDRCNYTIEYLDVLKEMSSKQRKILANVPDFYVSCTNKYLFESASKHNFKIILPYQDYCKNKFRDDDGIIDVAGKRIMISISPIIRKNEDELDREFPKQIMRNPDGSTFQDRLRYASDNQYFTHLQWHGFIKDLERMGINEIMVQGSPYTERERLIDFIGQYTRKELGLPE